MKIHDLIIKFSLLIKKTPLFYIFAKRIRDKYAKEKLCSKDSQLCLEGYPCSANSFAHVFLQHLDPSIRIAHHCHAIANVKLGLKYKIPVIILIRKPIDAISSNIVRFNASDIRAIEEYIEFYTYIINNFEKFIVITFDDIVTNTITCIDLINKMGNFSFKIDEDIDDLKNSVKKYIKDWTIKYDNLDRISLPNKKRSVEKEKIKKKIIKNKRFEEANNVWNRILDMLQKRDFKFVS